MAYCLIPEAVGLEFEPRLHVSTTNWCLVKGANSTWNVKNSSSLNCFSSSSSSPIYMASQQQVLAMYEEVNHKSHWNHPFLVRLLTIPSLLNSIIIIQAAIWRQNVCNSCHSISSTHWLLPCPPAILQLSVSFFLVCTYTAVYKCWPDRHVVSCASLYYQVPIAIHFLNIMVLHCEDDIWWHQLRYRSFVIYV